MSTSRKVAGNALAQLAGKVVTSVSSLIIVAVITRKLGVSVYGDYVTVLAYGQLISVFADLGINIYAIQRLSVKDNPESLPEAGAMFGIRVVGAASILLLAGLAAHWLPYSSLVKQGIPLVLAAIFAQTVNSLFVSILQARLEMRYAALTEVVGRVGVMALTIAAIVLHAGLIGVVAANLVGNVINMVLSYRYAHRLVPFRLSLSPVLVRRILKAALPISITAILSYVYFTVDTVILSVVPIAGHVNSVEVGIYGSAYKVLTLLQLIPTILLGNIFPLLTDYVASDRRRAEGLLQKVFDLVSMISFPVTVAVSVLALPIVTFIAGPSFAPAAVPLRILALAVLLTYYNGLYTYTALALGRQRSLIWVYLVATVFNIVSNLLLIPHFSYVAASYTTMATEVIVLIGAWLVCRNAISFRFSLGRPLRFLAASLVVAVVLFPLRHVTILISGPLAVLVYAGILLACKVVSVSELKALVPASVTPESGL